MTKPITVLALLFFMLNARSQSISSILSNTFEGYSLKVGKPSKITKHTTFYVSSGVKKETAMVTYTQSLDTIIEKRFEESQLVAELVFIFDSKRNLIYRTFKNKVPLIGWQFESTTYVYDNTGLIERKSKDKLGRQLFLSKIKNDSLNNPVSLKTYDSKNNLVGYELADYDYPKNTWTHLVFSGNTTLISRNKRTIAKSSSENYVYNEFGDAVLYPRNWSKFDKRYFQIEYKYDKRGNWIDKKVFEVIKQGDEFKNKRLNKRIKRKIKYLD